MTYKFDLMRNLFSNTAVFLFLIVPAPICRAQDALNNKAINKDGSTLSVSSEENCPVFLYQKGGFSKKLPEVECNDDIRLISFDDINKDGIHEVVIHPATDSYGNSETNIYQLDTNKWVLKKILGETSYYSGVVDNYFVASTHNNASDYVYFYKFNSRKNIEISSRPQFSIHNYLDENTEQSICEIDSYHNRTSREYLIKQAKKYCYPPFSNDEKSFKLLFVK